MPQNNRKFKTKEKTKQNKNRTKGFQNISNEFFFNISQNPPNPTTKSETFTIVNKTN